MDFPASTTSSGEPRDGWTRDIPPTGCKPLLQRITSASAKRWRGRALFGFRKTIQYRKYRHFTNFKGPAMREPAAIIRSANDRSRSRRAFGDMSPVKGGKL